MLHVSLVEVDDDDDVALFGVSEELLVSETKSFGDGGVILEKGMVESFAVVVHEEEVQVASHDRTFIAGLEIERERERESVCVCDIRKVPACILCVSFSG